LKNSFRSKRFLKSIALSVIILIYISYSTEITECKHKNSLSYSKNKIIMNYKYLKKAEGDSQGNILNKGFVAKSGNWVYGTLDGYGLSKLNLKDLKIQKIYEGTVSNIYIIGKNIYFLNCIQNKNSTSQNYISRINEGQKQATRLIRTGVESFYIYKGSIYYYITKEKGKGEYYSIVKTNLDGKNQKILYKQYIKNYSFPYITLFSVNSKFLYFLKDGKSQLVKYDMEKKKIIDISKLLHKSGIKQIEKFIMDGQNIFFNVFRKPLLYKLSIDGKKLKLINNDSIIDSFNIDNKWVYFSSYKSNDPKNKIYKMNKDGKNKMKISDIDGYNLNIIDNWIFCNGGREETNFYMINTNGTGYYKKIR
jgi:uncharacterized protein involved in tolerance to divalent cations